MDFSREQRKSFEVLAENLCGQNSKLNIMAESNVLLKTVGTNRFVVYNKLTRETLLVNGDVSDFSAIDLEVIFEHKNEESFDARKILTTIVINITEACNLRCKYCSRYKGHYDNEKTISQELLCDILQKASLYAASIGERVVIQFHGGEPLIHFPLIKKAILSNLGANDLLDFRIQTNATLLTNDILAFCKEHEIHLGISVDGPPSINAITRQFQDGTGIDKIISEKIELIKQYLPRHTISCLCVLSAANVEHASEVMDFVFEKGIDDVSILPLYPDFSNCLTDDNHIIPRTKDMIQFSVRVFDIWISELQKGRKISIPNFQIWFWNMMGGNSNYKLNTTSCGVGQSMIFVDKDGEVYPCGPFSYEKNFSMGNIEAIENIQQLYNSEIFQLFSKRETSKVEKCLNCALQGICLGGCPANSYLQNKDIFMNDPFCEYWEGVLGYVAKRVIDNPHICEIIPEYSIRL